VVTDRGWALIGPDRRIAEWAAAALPAARQAIAASADAWRCGGTWFVGVDAFPNGPEGAAGAVDFPWAAFPLAPTPLHPAQLSVIRPGYPRPDPTEAATAARYRRTRDAAHLDGLLALGTPPRRFIKEPHSWILGIALNDVPADASPLVVWDGSHTLMQAALALALAPYPPAQWADIDITDVYVATRARIFATCQRRELPIRPGMATVLHRLALHGVAPWPDTATAPDEGRIIAYFRPQLPSVADWISSPAQ
jgi:hypothetical protein